MNYRHLASVVGLSLIAVFGTLACSSAPAGGSFDEKVKLAETLQVGAAKADVIKLLGEPNEVITKPDKESLAWRHPSDGYGTLVLNFEQGAFTMGGGFLKGKGSIKLGTAKKQ
jgi:hypothetical protein